MYKYVIAGQDCNKYAPKILNCFSTMDECITYLNQQGNSSDFRIEDFIIRNDFEDDDGDVIQIVTFAHKELFTKLFVDGFMIRNDCLHNGEINIFRIDNNDNFNSVYELLLDMYA